MTPCHLILLTTPKRFLLRGIWLGPKKPKRVVVWVHGLGSSMFSKLEIAERLVDKQTAVLVFNNRGHDLVTRISSTRGKRIKAGSAHERFVDCIDDIEGAIGFARKSGAKDIYLAGHSTGSQKSVYWAAKRGRGVRGVILLAPISDYSTGPIFYTKKQAQRAVAVARRYMQAGRKHELLPEGFDAQRFLSLYSGKGPEEIFTYWDPKRNPRTLKNVRLPVLVLLAGNDEFADRSAKKIAGWFEKHLRRGRVVVVLRVEHGFRGGEARVVKEIRRWMSMQ